MHNTMLVQSVKSNKSLFGNSLGKLAREPAREVFVDCVRYTGS